MAKHNDLGKKGELSAIEYLRKKAYKILKSNLFVSHKEVDILCEKNNFLVAVEVKTRTNSNDDLNNIVSNKKRKLLIEAVNTYIEENNIDKEVRFDIIFINNDEITHIEDAFNPFDFV